MNETQTAILEALDAQNLLNLYEIAVETLGQKPSPEAITGFFEKLAEDETIAEAFDKFHYAELPKMPKYKLLAILAMTAFFPNFNGLMLWADSNYKHLKDFAGLKTAKTLEFIRWRKLETIADLAKLKQLRKLRLVEADSLSDLSPLNALPEFRELALDVFRKDLNINVLANSSLKTLDLRYYPHDSLEPIAELSQLEELTMRLSTELLNFEGIKRLESLEFLRIEVAGKVKDFSPIRDLKSLKTLWLSILAGFYPKALDLSFIREMPQLETLRIERMPKEVTEISFLEGLSNLKELQLAYLYEVDDLSPLASLSKLEVLNFERNQKASDFSPLQKLPALRQLWLHGCNLKERGLAEDIRAMFPQCKIYF